MSFDTSWSLELAKSSPFLIHPNLTVLRCSFMSSGMFIKTVQVNLLYSQCWELLSLMSSLWCWIRFIITYLADYIPPGHKESDTTEHTRAHTHARSWGAKLFKKEIDMVLYYTLIVILRDWCMKDYHHDLFNHLGLFNVSTFNHIF